MSDERTFGLINSLDRRLAALRALDSRRAASVERDVARAARLLLREEGASGKRADAAYSVVSARLDTQLAYAGGGQA